MGWTVTQFKPNLHNDFFFSYNCTFIYLLVLISSNIFIFMYVLKLHIPGESILLVNSLNFIYFVIRFYCVDIIYIYHYMIYHYIINLPKVVSENIKQK